MRVPDFTELKAKETGEINAAGDQVKNNMRIREDEASVICATLIYLMNLSTMMTLAVIKTIKLVYFYILHSLYSCFNGSIAIQLNSKYVCIKWDEFSQYEEPLYSCSSNHITFPVMMLFRQKSFHFIKKTHASSLHTCYIEQHCTMNKFSNFPWLLLHTWNGLL